MTNYYNSLCNSRDTVYKKSKFGASGGSPNTTKTSRWWLASLFMVMSLFMGQFVSAQVSAYTFSQNTSGTYTPLSAARTVVFTATAAASSDPGLGDDQNFTLAAGTIPFNFNFDNVNYTGVNINTNGYVTFGAILPATSDRNGLTNTTAWAGSIVAVGRDLSSSNVAGNLGEISYEVLGSSPNRQFVIQYSKFRRYSTSATFTENFNFQIVLNETSNVINIVYGACTSTSTSTIASSQTLVGLRGPSTASFVNRTQTTGWSASTAGATNTTSISMRHTATISPASGLTFNFTPPAPPSVDLASTAIVGLGSSPCSNASVPLSVTIKNNAVAVMDFAVTNATVSIAVTGASTQTLTTTLTSGTLAVGASMDVLVSPNADFSLAGTHTLSASVTVTGDGNSSNNTFASSKVIASLPVASPFAESFATTTTPAGWNTTGWSIAASHGKTTNGLYKNIYNTVPTGQFNTISVGPLSATDELKFDYRVLNYSFTYPGTQVPPTGNWGNFKVQVSTDCGETFTDLATIDNTNHLVTDQSFTTKAYSLSSYVGQNVMIRILATWVAGDYFLDFDNFTIAPAPVFPPDCATGFTPSDLSSDLPRNLTLSWTAATGFPTSYDVYLSTTSGSSTPVANVTGTSYTPTTALAAGVTYYWSVVPKNANGDAVGCGEQSFITGTSLNYCTSVPTFMDGSGITNVVLGTLSNPNVSTNRYQNFTTGLLVPDLGTSLTIPMSVTYDTFDGIDSYTYATRVFIDFNQDGDFGDANENQLLGTSAATSPTTLSGTISIPSDALAGNTRMRVIGYDTDGNTACYNDGYANVEDYTVNITITLPCSGAPAAAVASSSVSGACVDVPFTLSATGQTTGLGITYQWESASDAAFTSGVTALGTALSQPIASQSATTYYRFATTCDAGPDTTYSNVVEVTQNGPLQCYCVPVITYGCGDQDVIGGVTLNTLVNNSGTACTTDPTPGSSPLVPGQEGSGYNDYTSNPLLTTQLQAGGTYSCVVTAGRYSENYAAWIDYDDSGTFESSERIGFTSTTVIGSGIDNTLGASASFPISLACNPPLGIHRLRIRAQYGLTSGSSITPCDPSGYGEVEDYLIEITTPVACPTPKNVAVTSGTITSEGATLTWVLGCAETEWDVLVQPAGSPAPTDSSTPTASALNTASYTVTGFNPETSYDFYVRAACDSAESVFSSWTLPVSFTTLFSCEDAIVLTDNVTATSGNLATTGGYYSNNACGFSTPGKEELYTFTSSSAGLYTLEVTGLNGGTGYIDYMFKEASLGCDATGWTCIDDNSAVGTDTFTLAANTTYFILLDAESAASTANHTFKISVVPPAPGCTVLSSPADGATGVTVGTIPFSWTAPAVTATEGAASSYDLYYGTSETPGVADNLIGNYTTTSTSIILTGYNATFYVRVVPKNANGEAVGPCTVTSFTTEADPFIPYCSSVTYSVDIEPITSVNFAGINNTSSNVVDGSPSIENFTAVSGNVEANSSYTMTIKGHTGGVFTSNLMVFADWNQDGDFADAGETYNAGSLFSSNGIDAVSAVSTIAVPVNALPGTTRMRIKKMFGAADNNPCIGAEYGQTEDYTLNVTGFTTEVTSPTCGSTLATPSSLVGVRNFSSSKNVTSYRYKATGPSGDLTVEKTTPHFQFSELVGWQYGTTYTVSCELQVGGVWAGYYGPTCSISTPNVVAAGLSQIVSPTCDTVVTPNTTIATTSLGGVTGYLFRVTNTTLGYSGTNAVQTEERTSHWFRLNMLDEYVYNSTYTVEVAVKTSGAYGAFGPVCTFTTTIPVIAQCGTTVNAGSLISSTSLGGVTQYAYQVTNLSDNSVQNINRTSPHFSTSLITGYSSTTSYSISVAVTSTGVQSPYTQPCVINPTPAVREIDSSYASELKVQGFPNPFTNNFTLDITRASEEKVAVMVYDMIGKLLDRVDVNATDNSLELGANYPAGVYNVIVSQGEKVETVRMVKR